MPPKLNTNCSICKVKTTTKGTLKCTVCKGHFCANVKCAQTTEKVVGIMTNERKKSWKCQKCRQGQEKLTNKTPKSSTSTPITGQIPQPHMLDTEIISETLSNLRSPSQPNDYLTPPSHRSTPESTQDNITHRNKYTINIPIENSFSSLDDDDHEEEITKSLSRSCSEIITMRARPEDTEEMKKQICNLQGRLLSAENEIDNLLSENYSLKNRLVEYESKIKYLTTICRSTDKINIPKSNSKRKHRRKTLDYLLVNSTQNSEAQNSLTEQYFETKNIDNVKCYSNQSDQDASTDYTKKTSDQVTPDTTKICIISSTSKDVLIMSERNLENARLCHYKLNQGGICRLFENLHSKLSDFTLSDYCVIFIGEPDFEVTKDYKVLVEHIRTTLQKVQHTNIILCLPCFKYNNKANVFNNRIETFNSLLYRDNIKFQYAVLFDSNKNLEYSYSMFSRFTGKVNRNGMAIIFSDLKHLISCITHSYSNLPTTATFFRK